MTSNFSVVLPPSSSTQPSEDNSPKHPKSKSTETLDEKGENTETLEKDSKAVSEPSTRDPLNWFGILLPPALRQSQAAFKSAVMGTIPALASTVEEMKEVELDVRRTRKKLRKAG